MKYQHLFHEIFIWFSVNVYFPSINSRQIWTNPFSRASTGSRSPVISGILRCLPLFKDSLIMNICKSPLEHKNTDTEPPRFPFPQHEEEEGKKNKKTSYRHRLQWELRLSNCFGVLRNYHMRSYLRLDKISVCFHESSVRSCDGTKWKACLTCCAQLSPCEKRQSGQFNIS